MPAPQLHLRALASGLEQLHARQLAFALCDALARLDPTGRSVVLDALEQLGREGHTERARAVVLPELERLREGA